MRLAVKSILGQSQNGEITYKVNVNPISEKQSKKPFTLYIEYEDVKYVKEIANKLNLEVNKDYIEEQIKLRKEIQELENRRAKLTRLIKSNFISKFIEKYPELVL